MFGYVRPMRDELKLRELDSYQAVYCGLCHTLGHRYGFLSRMFLNYDFTFLSMVLDPVQERPETRRRRCIACPLQGKMVCTYSTGLDTAADASVILTYWKLRDNVSDSSFWRGLPARLLSLLLGPAYRKASGLRPDFNQKVITCLAELSTLEGDCSPSLDRTADTFARILQAAAPPSECKGRDRAVEQLLYHVGRWIYLVDGWDDLDEDRKCGAYNPVAARFPDGPEPHREELRATMRHSLNLAYSAYSLLDSGYWSGILSNILYLGLPMVEEAVFSGQWKRIQNGEETHERSLQRPGRQSRCQ